MARSALLLAGTATSLSLSSPPIPKPSSPVETVPAPRWSFTADEAQAHLALYRDTTFRVPASRSARIKKNSVYVLHTTGEGTCESNRDFLRGIRGSRRIPPLAHVLLCEDGMLYELAHRDRVTTGLGRMSSLRGDSLPFERAYNIEIQGNPWEPRTNEQRATLEAFFTNEAAQGRYADSLVYAHAFLASEPLPGVSRLRMTGRKPDGIRELIELGIPLQYAEDVLLFPLHQRLFTLEREGRLTHESLNETFGFVGRVQGHLAWRIPAKQSAYPMLGSEFSSAAALYYFPSSGELVSGAQLLARTKGGSSALYALPEEAIVLLSSRRSSERTEALPRIRAELDFVYGRKNIFGATTLPFALLPRVSVE